MKPQERIPLAAFGAALISIAALSITARGLPLLWVFAAAILASPFVKFRLVNGTLLRWFLRIMLIGTVIVLTRDDSSGSFEGFGPTHTRDIFGELCAAEMTIQFWRWRTYDPRRSTVLIMLVSGLTFLTASNTFEETFIRFLAPPYLLCIALMANGYRARGPRLARGAMRAAPLALSGLALAAAIAVGALGYRTTIVYRAALTDIGNKVILKGELTSEGAGMSAQPNLGPVFGLRGSPARILKINNFTGDEHLIGVAYDSYSGGQWGPAIGERTWDTVSSGLIVAPKEKLRGEVQQMFVTRLVNDNPLVYVPLAASSVDFGEEKSISRVTDEGGPIRVRSRAPYQYSIEVSQNDLYQGLFASPLTPEQRAVDLSTPSDDPNQTDVDMDRVERLARNEFGHILSQKKRVEAVTNYLLTHHAYSLNYKPGGSIHEPLADFLLSQPPKAAHCEFFASGAALLLRYVAIPTRYVTGYYVHEVGENGEMIVRQRDAHAWCEAWIDGTGWVTVEATPVSGRPDAPNEETPVEPWRRLWEWIQDKGQALSDLAANVTLTQVGGITMAVTAGFGGLMALRSYARRRGVMGVAAAELRYSPPSVPELEAMATRFEQFWSRKMGSPVPQNRSYTEFLQSYVSPPPERADDGEFAARVREFATIYEAARFGGQAAPDVQRHLENLLREMEASLH